MAPSYITLPQDEETLLSTERSEDQFIRGFPHVVCPKPPVLNHPSILHWIAHILTILLLAILLVPDLRAISFPHTKELYSAAYGDRARPLHLEVFKSAFWEDTVYKAYPNPPVNKTLAAWDHLTETPAMNLTASELSQLGLSTDSVQWPKSAGGGYIAYLESAHQLHCLQSIWMRHHYDKNPSLPIFAKLRAKIQELPDIEEAHFEHCVDIIRQRLRCTADTSIVTFRWVKGVSTPYPNFHSRHMCADYEGLLAWGVGRKADMSKVEGWDYHANLAEGDKEIDYLPK